MIAPEITPVYHGRISIRCYGSSNLKRILKGFDLQTICRKVVPSPQISVQVKASGNNSVRPPRLLRLIGEIGADVRRLDQYDGENSVYLIIHIGYNRFSDRDISKEYYQHYLNFLRQLAAVFPPEKIVLYLPFIRGTGLDQIQSQYSVVQSLHRTAFQLGYFVRSLFSLLPVPIEPTQDQILKWYSSEKNSRGEVKAIHFSDTVKTTVRNDLKAIFSGIVSEPPTRRRCTCKPL